MDSLRTEILRSNIRFLTDLQDGGSTICWFSPIWSLELYQQMNARLFRQGQKAQTVVILHIICRDTIDERVLRVLSAREKIQDALIEAVRAEIKSIKRSHC